MQRLRRVAERSLRVAGRSRKVADGRKKKCFFSKIKAWARRIELGAIYYNWQKVISFIQRPSPTAERPRNDRRATADDRFFYYQLVFFPSCSSYLIGCRRAQGAWSGRYLRPDREAAESRFRSEVRNARVEDPVLDSDRRETMWGATRPLRLRFVWLQSCEAYDAVFRRHGCARRRDQCHSRLGDRQYREVYRASHTSAAGRHVNLGRKYPPSRETIHHAEHAHVHESAQAKQRADCRRGSRHRRVIDYIYYLEY